jgi:hypothetical protein
MLSSTVRVGCRATMGGLPPQGVLQTVGDEAGRGLPRAPVLPGGAVHGDVVPKGVSSVYHLYSGMRDGVPPVSADDPVAFSDLLAISVGLMTDVFMPGGVRAHLVELLEGVLFERMSSPHSAQVGVGSSWPCPASCSRAMVGSTASSVPRPLARKVSGSAYPRCPSPGSPYGCTAHRIAGAAEDHGAAVALLPLPTMASS